MKKLICLLVCALFPLLAVAQAAPTLTFTAKTTVGVESVIPELTWATTPAANSCTASGDAAWTGSKGASGTVILAAATTSRTYSLVCTWLGDTTATVKWTIPTLNTDGSPLTNLAGFKIKYGLNPAALDKVFDLNRATATSQAISGLAPGLWTFGVLAYNSASVESALSNTATKTITSAANVTRSVSLVVDPRPNAPTGTTVE